MNLSSSKRFIAGAVCPRCGKMDRIVMYKEDGRQFRECVSCGFRDEMRFNQVGRELETRLNRNSGERKAEVRTVRIVDPRESSE